MKSTTPLLLTLVAMLSPLVAAAQVTPSERAPVVPYRPYLDEHIGIRAWSGYCPDPIYDGRHAPQIRQLSHVVDVGIDVYHHELTYRMVRSEACTIAPKEFAAPWMDIGALPRGFHYIHVEGIEEDGDVFVEYDAEIVVRETDTVRDDASGIWYSPEQNGRGVTVVLDQSSSASPPLTAVVYWATHDTEGNPAWNVLVGGPYAGAWGDRNVIEGTAITTSGDPLMPGTAQLRAAPWGEVRFEYQHCGHATLTWDADDAAIEDGSLALVQVMRPSGVYLCDVEAMEHVDAEQVE